MCGSAVIILPMKFGMIDDADEMEFSLPKRNLVIDKDAGSTFRAWVGLPKWNKADIKRFYPIGTGDELRYYSTQYNSVELNATFYRVFPGRVLERWREVTSDDFLFFTRMSQSITHYRRLKDFEPEVNEFLDSISNFQHKFGACLMQMHNMFGPDYFDRVEKFIACWDKDVPLHIEFRHTDWHNDPAVAPRLYELLEENKIGNVIVDTAGRRDLLHMRLTTPTAYIRFVGANVESDYARLDAWVDRIAEWKAEGLRELYFFIHQNINKELVELSIHFIERLNEATGTNLLIPKLAQRP